MFRITSSINRSIKDVSDSIRFLSKSKKRALYYSVAGISTLTTTGTYLAVHTVFIDKSVEKLCAYQNFSPVLVIPHIQKLFDQALADVDQQLKNDANLKPFNFVGTEFYSLGSTKLPTGARIGLPFYISVTDKGQLRASDIRLLGSYKTKRSGSSEVIQRLFDSLLLSDDAKRYAIAHQLNLVSSSAIFAKTFNIAVCTAGSFMLSRAINTRFFSKRKVFLRLGTFFLSFSLVTVLLGAFIDQLLDEVYSFKAMKKTISINDSYKNGAAEFYEKFIQKNICTFELLGPLGSKYLTEDGKNKKLFGLWNESFDGHLILAKNFK